MLECRPMPILRSDETGVPLLLLRDELRAGGLSNLGYPSVLALLFRVDRGPLFLVCIKAFG